MKKTKVLSICIITIMLLVSICPIISNAAEPVKITFKDSQLAENVENELKTRYSSQADSVSRVGLELTLDQSLINNVTELYVGNNTQTDSHITDLTGLEKFTNLQTLSINNGHYTDLTPIIGLTKLEKLSMSASTKLSSIENLGKLTSLKELAISNCNLKSLKGLEKLTNLEVLLMSNEAQNVAMKDINSITDFSPIQNLTKLKILNISNYNDEIAGNKLENLDVFKNLTSLETLEARFCGIRDISALSNMKNLKTFRGDANRIESIENLSFNNIETFWLTWQNIKKFIKLSDYNTNEITVDLPQIFAATRTQGSLIYTGSDFTVENGTVSSDYKKITAKVADIKAGNVTVKINGYPAEGSTVTYYEALEVLDVKKELETENADKVKVTITVNKELDSDKIPDGWTLSDDKKSISKEFDKNGTENVTLTDKDGSTVTQKVEVSNIKDGNEEKFKVIDEKQEDAGNGKVKVTITVNKELDPSKIPDGWTLSEDGKSIWKVMDKGASEDLTLVSKDGEEIKYTVTAGEEFKVINKTEEDQGNGKIKVTITVNKELDPSKIPDGWTLSEDGKSIWKVMDKGASEDLTLVAKDGSTIKYTVTAGDKTTAPGKIPQTGVKNTIIVVVAGIAIVGTVVFVRSRKMLK